MRRLCPPPDADVPRRATRHAIAKRRSRVNHLIFTLEYAAILPRLRTARFSLSLMSEMSDAFFFPPSDVYYSPPQFRKEKDCRWRTTMLLTPAPRHAR